MVDERGSPTSAIQAETQRPFVERRQQNRYGVRAVVNFQWMDAGGVLHHGQGLTRDISPKGMFIYSDAKPPAKADVEVDVDLHSVPGTATDLRLAAKALVVRVESPIRPKSHHGFAVLNRSYRLRNSTSRGRKYVEDEEFEN